MSDVAPTLEIEPPRSRTACRSLPPEGAAAPAVWQSQSRGPCPAEEPPRTLALCASLPFHLKQELN